MSASGVLSSGRQAERKDILFTRDSPRMKTGGQTPPAAAAVIGNSRTCNRRQVMKQAGLLPSLPRVTNPPPKLNLRKGIEDVNGNKVCRVSPEPFSPTSVPVLRKRESLIDIDEDVDYLYESFVSLKTELSDEDIETYTKLLVDSLKFVTLPQATARKIIKVGLVRMAFRQDETVFEQEQRESHCVFTGTGEFLAMVEPKPPKKIGPLTALGVDALFLPETRPFTLKVVSDNADVFMLHQKTFHKVTQQRFKTQYLAQKTAASKIPAFSKFDEADQERLISATEENTYPSESLICEEGSKVCSLFILVDGNFLADGKKCDSFIIGVSELTNSEDDSPKWMKSYYVSAGSTVLKMDVEKVQRMFETSDITQRLGL